MGRSGSQPESAESLRKRGSSLAKKRAEQERAELVPMTGRPWLTDALAVAIMDRDRHGMSCVDIAREAGISEAYLSMFLSGKTNLSGESIDRLCWALNLRLCSPDGTIIPLDR